MTDQRTADRLSTTITLGAQAIALYLAFTRIDDWASVRFAEAPLASMLVAVIDLGLFAVALCLAPALSRALSMLLSRRPG